MQASLSQQKKLSESYINLAAIHSFIHLTYSPTLSIHMFIQAPPPCLHSHATLLLPASPLTARKSSDTTEMLEWKA